VETLIPILEEFYFDKVPPDFFLNLLLFDSCQKGNRLAFDSPCFSVVAGDPPAVLKYFPLLR
jgi:hypothetical protein